VTHPAPVQVSAVSTMPYVVLLRGINVGGRNKVPMAALRDRLSEDFRNVRTYLQSGNVLLESALPAGEMATHLEHWLPTAFDLESELIRVLVLDATAYLEVVADAPPGFGTRPETYRYDVGFYVGITAADVEAYMSVNPDVDEVAYGGRAFYFRRISALASRTRLTRIMGTPIYASLTLRNWRTTTSIAGMLEPGEP
jgi:uncharacterized protein (DUF1697 family)